VGCTDERPSDLGPASKLEVRERCSGEGRSVIGRDFYIPPKFRKAKSAERAGVNPAHPALRSTSASGRPCPRDLEWEPSTARMRRDGAGSVSARELGNTAPRL